MFARKDGDANHYPYYSCFKTFTESGHWEKSKSANITGGRESRYEEPAGTNSPLEVDFSSPKGEGEACSLSRHVPAFL